MGGLGVLAHIPDELGVGAQAYRQAEGGAEYGELGKAAYLLHGVHVVDDITDPTPIGLKIGVDAADIPDVGDEGLSEINGGHVDVAVDHLRPQGLRLEVVAVGEGQGDVHAVPFVYQLDGLHHLAAVGEVELPGRNAGHVLRVFVYLSETRRVICLPEYGGRYPSQAVQGNLL